MNKAEYIAIGIVLWSWFLGLFLPREWAMALYRGPFGRMWDGLVRVMDRGWSALVRLIVRTGR